MSFIQCTDLDQMHLKLLRIRVAWFTMSWISASLPQAIRSPSKLSRRRQRTFSASFSLSPTPPGAPYRLHVVDRWTIKKDLFHRVQGLLFLLIFIQKCFHIIHKLASIKRNEHLVNSAASHVSWLMASLLAPSLPSLPSLVSSPLNPHENHRRCDREVWMLHDAT